VLGVDENVQWIRDESGLRVKIPEKLNTELPFVIKIMS